MTVLQRIQREPAALLGFAAALLGVLTLTEVLDPVLAGSIGTAIGAAVTLLRYFVTPTSEVLAQAVPDGDDQVKVVAGPAASIPTGAPADVVVRRAPVDTAWPN